MARHIHLANHLSSDELERRYRVAREPHERSWWQILWLLSKGQTATTIAEYTGYSRYWIGQIAKRYDVEGPAGMHNRQHTTPGVRPACSRRNCKRNCARRSAAQHPMGRNAGERGQWPTG